MIALPRVAKLLLASSWLLFIACGCIFTSVRSLWPLLYRPSCDLQPMLALHLPHHIDTLEAVPRNETIVKNGINQNVGGRQPDDIKEWFCVWKGRSKYDCDTEFDFFVFFTESAAIRWYESERRWRSKDDPVFREASGDSGSACVHYTEQERADPEGGSGPTGIYHARVSFRLRNTFISITTNERTSKSDKLTLAVRDLAQMLTVALASTNRLSQ
jgi:hypothetical protein